MQFWRDRRFLGSLVVSICLIVLMVVTSSPERVPTPLERLWHELLAPAQSILTDISHEVEDVLGGVLRYRTVMEENELLREKVVRLQAVETHIERLSRENQRLRSMLQLQREAEIKSLNASVLARSPSEWTHEFSVDKGEADGVSTGDVVVVPEGLVGRVIRTTPRTSTVMLITSPESGLGVELAATGDAGVAEGQIEQRGKLRVRFFDPAAEVSKGTLLITSGLSQFFPHGIAVGEVVQRSTGELGLLAEVWVEPRAALNRLREVTILSVSEPGSLEWPTLESGDD